MAPIPPAPATPTPETIATTPHRYDDTSKYHPHDIKILSHFPDEQLSSLHGRYFHYRRLYRLCKELETNDIPTITDACPTPPPRAPEELEPGVEAWRTAALQAIDARIVLYAQPRLPATTHRPRISSNVETCRATGPEHQALRIPEVLEAILHHATPSAQYSAWHVSVRWRAVVEQILRPKSSLHAPVEHGQAIDQCHAWLQPSAEDIARFEQEVTAHLQAPPSHYFYPALLTQAQGLSQSTYAAARTLLQRHYGVSTADFPELKRPQWLDLGQFTFSPYFLDLFPGRLQLKPGRCEIALPPELFGSSLIQCQLPASVFLHLVGDMFLTEPPCMTIGIYHLTTQPDGYAMTERSTRVHNDEGVRIRDIILALRGLENETMDVWKNQVHKIRQQLATADWTAFTFQDEKSRLWKMSGYPKFILFLEPSRDSAKTLAPDAYNHAVWEVEDSATMFRSEWFQDVERDWNLKTYCPE